MTDIKTAREVSEVNKKYAVTNVKNTTIKVSPGGLLAFIIGVVIGLLA